MTRIVAATVGVLFASAGLAGCGTSSSPGAADAAAPVDAGAPKIGGSRPVSVHVPPSYVSGTPMPLLVMLHGYSASGAEEELYLNFTPLADARGFIYAYPDGTKDSTGNQFWNATNACCNLDDSPVDDSAYLSSVITELEAAYTIDPKRVFVMGHSNGGFMSYRMACDHGDQIAAIASLAGAMWLDVSKCPAAVPVSVLEIHGNADEVIDYDGGTIMNVAYPGAVTTVGDWVKIDGCSSTPDTTSPPLDLDTVIPGNETTVTKYASGCKPGGHAELWTIQGGSHVPSTSSTFSPDILDFLFAHPKP